MLTDAARKLARRRTWAALAIFAVAALVAPFAPLPSFGMMLRAGPVSAARVYQPPTGLNPPDLVDKATMAPRERPPKVAFSFELAPVYSLHTFS